MIALTLVGTQDVDASAVVAYVWIALTFIDIDTIVSVTSQRKPGMTDTLKAALQIAAYAIAANARSLVTFIDVDTIVLAGSKFVASWTHTFEITLLVNTLCIPAAGIRYLKTVSQTLTSLVSTFGEKHSSSNYKSNNYTSL